VAEAPETGEVRTPGSGKSDRQSAPAADSACDPWVDLAAAARQAANIADSAHRASHALLLAIESSPELSGPDTQMLGLLLSELAGRLEELSALTARFSQYSPGGQATGGAEGGPTQPT